MTWSLDDLIKGSPNLKYDFIFLGKQLMQKRWSNKNNTNLYWTDADKGNYKNYYELIMKHDLLSDYGVLIADNSTL